MGETTEKSDGNLTRFRVEYSAKWGFGGTLEVTAKDADDAKRMAETMLGEKAEQGDFDKVQDFDAKFEDAIVLEVKEDYAAERRHAVRIAAFSDMEFDGEKAAKAVAGAVVECEAHPVTVEDDGTVRFEYDNSFGPTCLVDDVLERMNMRDWRLACDEFCMLSLERGGLNPEDFDWPTPLPEVTKVPENGDTDVVARVRVAFRVDRKTRDAIRWTSDDRGEETCCECDAQIGYRVESGKSVVTCPECGAVNPLCNECRRPERERNACDSCGLLRKCKELNGLRAEARDGKGK